MEWSWVGPWHKFCNFQNKRFLLYTILLPVPVGPVSFPEPAISTDLQLRASEPQGSDSPTVCFVYLPAPTVLRRHPPPHHHLKATPLHFSLPRCGPFLPLSKPSSRKRAGKDSLPVWTAAGEVWGQGRERTLGCDPTRRKGGHPGVLSFPLSCFSSLLEASNRTSDLT